MRHCKNIIALLLSFAFALAACEKESTPVADNVVGTWHTGRSFALYSASDSCTGTYARFDSALVGMTWNISFLQDNVVDIDATTTGSEPTRLDTACKLNVQYSFPVKYRGIVNATQMVVVKSYYPSDTSGLAYLEVGKFTYKGNAMTGYLRYQLCDTLHCYGYQTDAGAVSLSR